MGRGIKIGLPGFNAFEDTNPDHFSLYVDQDDDRDLVLIKEFDNDQVTVTTSRTIAHNLGYVPYCQVFFESSSGVWRKVFSKAIDGTGSYFTVDNTNLTLYGTGNFIYHIFLDNVTDGDPDVPDLGEHLAFVVAKKGYNAATDKNPNHFIFHSDFNTFKIIKEATKEITLAASTNNQSFTQAHNLSFIPLVNAFAMESGRDQVFLPNSDNISLYGVKDGWSSTGVRFNYVSADSTNVIFNFNNTNGSTKAVSIRYFILEKID